MQSTNKPIQLLGIGNTIVDLEYSVDDSLLTKLGIEKGSMTLIDHARKSELVSELGDDYKLSCGGSIANSIYIATKFGCSTHHIGVIGNDPLASYTIGEYNKHDIGHSFSDTQTEGESGCCLVLITPDGERTMLTFLGVSSQFKSVLFMKPLVKQSQVLFIEGYLLSDNFCLAMLRDEIIPYAKSVNTSLILSLSDAGLVSFFHTQFEELVALGFDTIFCNRKEAESLSKSNSIEEISTYFKEYTTSLIMTDAGNGAFAIDHESQKHFPTESIIPVDSTGAGDAFAGAFIAKTIQDASIEDCVSVANKISRIVIEQFGARPKHIDSVLTSIV